MAPTGWHPIVCWKAWSLRTGLWSLLPFMPRRHTRWLAEQCFMLHYILILQVSFIHVCHPKTVYFQCERESPYHSFSNDLQSLAASIEPPSPSSSAPALQPRPGARSPPTGPALWPGQDLKYQKNVVIFSACHQIFAVVLSSQPTQFRNLT